MCRRDVVDGGVGDRSTGVFLDALKDLPGAVGEGRVGGDAVQDEDGFDGFGPNKVGRVSSGFLVGLVCGSVWAVVGMGGGRKGTRAGLPEAVAPIANVGEARR